jgi:hypothetical protein
MSDLRGRYAAPADPVEYYEAPAVRRAILEYCGATDSSPATTAYVCGLDAQCGLLPLWDRSTCLPPADIAVLWGRGADISRALWDREHLILLLDIDYQNIDSPGEPYLRPAEVFFKLEPIYRAAVRVFTRYGLPPRPIMTGRGYQFTGRIPLGDPTAARLAALAPGVPVWHVGVEQRRRAGVDAPLSSEHARSSMGLGLVTEYLAHRVLAEAQPDSRVPVVFNGTHVGAGVVGRECASIDFSHVGDPLDIRHMRVAFSTYQWHRLRPDIFGEVAASRPTITAIPRVRESLVTMLAGGHGLDTGARAATRSADLLPDVTAGVAALADEYADGALAVFHRHFYVRRRDPSPIDPAVFDGLPACLQAPLATPNDLLLRPEYVQHLVRGLMARGCEPAAIAGLVQRQYESDHGWGDRWQWMHPATRAEFEVRVFAGMIATGLDQLIDLNCVSAQEKDLCPRLPCPHDLRRDRAALRALWP